MVRTHISTFSTLPYEEVVELFLAGKILAGFEPAEIGVAHYDQELSNIFEYAVRLAATILQRQGIDDHITLVITNDAANESLTPYINQIPPGSLVYLLLTPYTGALETLSWKHFSRDNLVIAKICNGGLHRLFPA